MYASRTLPYRDFRTNVLAIMGQLILVFSFFSTVLLKADMAGEVLTDDRVGILMVVVNVPMAVFFVWDVWLDVQEHFAAVEDLVVQQQLTDEDATAAGDDSFTNPLDVTVEEE